MPFGAIRLSKPLVINFFGASCTGKSTHSAGLFAELKRAGVNVELGREYCKNFFYEGTQYKLGNQMLVTGKQIEQVETFSHGGCDVIIMDSPILLGALYSQVYNRDIDLCMSIRKKFHTYNNYNILMISDVDFVSHGRGKTGLSRDIISELLVSEGLHYDRTYKTTELKSYTKLVSAIIKKLS